MPDPVAEHISTLEQNNRNLYAKRVECARERTQSAEYAVNLEDQVRDLLDERSVLIMGLYHLYEHLTGQETTIVCEDIHPKIKEYVKDR